MDINNYSYVNSSGSSSVIAESCGDYGFPCVFFELESNWFGDRFYYVHNIMSDDGGTFEFSDVLSNYDDERTAYTKAARFYNSLVPDADAVPLF